MRALGQVASGARTPMAETRLGTDAKMAEYARTARARAQARRKRLEVRRARAWLVAEQAAALLRDKHGAQRVVVFGSVLKPARFHEESDVDLAVWGLDERVYLRALSDLLALDPKVEVDLVEAEGAGAGLLSVIEREGQAL